MKKYDLSSELRFALVILGRLYSVIFTGVLCAMIRTRRLRRV